MFLPEGHRVYRVRLTEEQRAALQRRTRAAHVKPRTRDRLEMVRLADAGWRIPQIARHLRVSPQRVRVWMKRFLEEGFDALADQPHRGRPPRWTPTVEAAVCQELAKGDRTWTVGQLAAWLAAEHGVRFSRNRLGVVLREAGLTCRRTQPDLGHQQDPAAVAVAAADLQTLEKGATPGAWMSAT